MLEQPLGHGRGHTPLGEQRDKSLPQNLKCQAGDLDLPDLRAGGREPILGCPLDRRRWSLSRSGAGFAKLGIRASRSSTVENLFRSSLIHFHDVAKTGDVGRIRSERGHVIARHVLERELAATSHQLPQALGQSLVVRV